MPSLYLITPTADFPGYSTPEVFPANGLTRLALMAELSMTTVAAMAPRDFDIKLCDEYLDPVDFNSEADFIGITGKITQATRMNAIADRFRAQGKTVLIGGPCASLAPDLFREHCDILVRGEIEAIAEQMFSDLRGSCWKDDYHGDRPDITRSPIPRWDLYPNDRAINGCIQTARGCPFECEFCDVIQYLGRTERDKTVPQVIEELKYLYKMGYRSVYIADDNFTVHRSRAKELLDAIRHWNERNTGGRMVFGTQVSIDASRDEELLEMCARAGLTSVFVGIETPNEGSLKEVKKRQNLKLVRKGEELTLNSQLERFTDHGIVVSGGMIVGFDNDDMNIFRIQRDFAESTDIPFFTLGALVAPRQTPLHARLKKEGRLLDDATLEVAARPWGTNIVPRLMTHEQLMKGTKWLASSLYNPVAFEHRVMNYVARIEPVLEGRKHGIPAGTGAPQSAKTRSALMQLLDRVPRLGDEEAAMKERIVARADRGCDELQQVVIGFLVQYMIVRHMFERGSFWEASLYMEPEPAVMANAF